MLMVQAAVLDGLQFDASLNRPGFAGDLQPD